MPDPVIISGGPPNGLPAASPLSGTESVPVDQGASTVATTTAAIAAVLPDATPSTAGKMTAADKTKLNGIAVGATANSSDAALVNRSNHTGTQAAATISDFAAAVRLQIQGGLEAGSNVSIAPTGSGASLEQVISVPGLSTAVRSLTAGITGASTVANLVTISQEDYDDLPSYDPTTLYYIPDGGGGGSIALDGLTDVVITSPATNQVLLFNGTNWVNAAAPGGGGGTVTSVGLTAPTGFSVSGSPVTTSGTLAFTFASGYALPTTAKQTEWDTAFSQTRQWSGGATGLVAATGRASLGLGTAALSASTDFAPAAQGVTNGNSHDHSGGDGAQIAYGNLSGLPTLGSLAALSTLGNITSAGAIGSTATLPIITTTGGVLTTGAFGATAGTFCQGNDSRLSDARTPTAHNQAWSTITGTPTTLSGYGITDAQPLDSDLTSIAALTTTSFGRSFLDRADAAAARTHMGLGTAATSAASAFSAFVASGTATLGTTAIASGASATLVTVAATGVATTDVIDWGFNGNPNTVTGYNAASTTGCLVITAYPTAGNVNFLVSNPTAASITPGALTLNWKVTR